jgi:hypothetical protein
MVKQPSFIVEGVKNFELESSGYKGFAILAQNAVNPQRCLDFSGSLHKVQLPLRRLGLMQQELSIIVFLLLFPIFLFGSLMVMVMSGYPAWQIWLVISAFTFVGTVPSAIVLYNRDKARSKSIMLPTPTWAVEEKVSEYIAFLERKKTKERKEG